MSDVNGAGITIADPKTKAIKETVVIEGRLADPEWAELKETLKKFQERYKGKLRITVKPGKP